MFFEFLLRMSSVCKLVFMVVEICVNIGFFGDKFFLRIFVMSFVVIGVIEGVEYVFILFFLFVILVRIVLI